MAEPQTPDRRDTATGDPRLFTLSEVAQRTGISMPTLQRYKKTYQDRIPSVGAGRKQRYPEHSLPVFEELRTENASKRGRPRKNAASARPAASSRNKIGSARRTPGRKPGRPAAAARAAAAPARRGRPPGRTTAKRGPGRPPAAAAKTSRGGKRGVAAKSHGLLTLTEISRTTGISYPTLVRYVRLYSDRLKHEGKGRARRFYPEAVAAFRTLRQESSRGGRRGGAARRGAATGARRGRPPKAASASTSERLEAGLRQRMRELEKLQEGLQKRFSDLVKGLQKLF
jgi:predicted DNA-binding transcriptional regulator AlpA